MPQHGSTRLNELLSGNPGANQGSVFLIRDVEPVPVDEFRIGIAETYDVIVEPKEEKPFTIFAESLDRSGYARGTLAPREGMELENGNGQHNPRKHTLLVQPAQRISARVTARDKGRWAFHCHILYHMERGMFQVVQVADEDGSIYVYRVDG